MSSVDSSEPTGWSDRVTFREGAEGKFAYRPRQVVVRGAAARDAVTSLYPGAEPTLIGDGGFLIPLPPGTDVMSVVADLRDDGYRAEPNYVLFAHTMQANTMAGNPLWGNPLWGNPLWGNPLWGNPLWGNPLWGNPLWGNPTSGDGIYLDQFQMTGFRPNTARPAPPPKLPPVYQGSRQSPSIVILDTGVADTGHRPQFLNFLAGTPASDVDVPHSGLGNKFGAMDPAAGHGSFIAGIIEQRVPGRNIAVNHVLEPLGDVDAVTVGARLEDMAANAVSGPTGNFKVDAYTILNLSFGGHAADLEPDEMRDLARGVRKVQAKGAVVVASAGNGATSRRSYPACLRDVISVAALGENGPAPFTNYGPWVRACAPGVNLVSSFFTDFDGPVEVGLLDPDKFDGWARWSGTSFAAPVVVGALAREMVRTGCTAAEAVERVIDAPGLLSLPWLGTVVNIA